jgi:lambda family phage portal protein
MNFLNRLKTASRFLLNPQARFEGASFVTHRSYIPEVVQSPRWDVDSITRNELVRRSRYFEKNNAFVNRLADLQEQYTVGAGIEFFPASSDPVWNVAALRYWRDWQRFADLSSRQSFGTLQGIIARAVFVDGESFILLTEGDTGRPRIQLVETHRVKNFNNAGDTDELFDGIRLDPRGRPVAYDMVSESASRRETWFTQPADFVVHVFEPSRAGQLRGLPAIYPVLNDIADLDELQLLEMQAAKQAAEVTNVIKTATGEVEDEDIIRGTQTGGDGVERANYYREVFGAKAKVLKHGDEFGQFRVERPSAATSGYWDSLVNKICVGTGIPKEIAIPTSMQGTSMRSVHAVANQYFRSRSAVIAEHLRRVFEFVIERGIKTDPTLKNPPADWFRSTYRSPRSISVDMGYDSTAMVNEFKAGMRTLQSIYAESGEDWREQLRQRALEIAYANELATEFKVERAEIMALDPNELASQNAATTPAK